MLMPLTIARRYTTGLYLPVRVTQRPDRIAEPIRPIINGTVERPLAAACTPWPIWMKIGRKATVLMNAIEIRKPARLAVVNTRFLNRSNGRIGSHATPHVPLSQDQHTPHP